MRQLSIIIPAYNEEKVIKKTIKHIMYQMVKHRLFDYEIIVVDDCSTDKTVEELLKLKYIDELMFVSNNKNKGKGYSIKRGLGIARYNNVLVLDADLSVNVSEIFKFRWEWLIEEKIVKGIRTQVERQPLYRILLGQVWKVLVWMKTRIYQDTQCPFLFIHSRYWIEEVRRNITIDGFAYDIEIVNKFPSMIRWVSVDYYNVEESSVTPKKILRMLLDLLRLK